jgi:phytoene dehydrogenase-like protein
MSADISATVAIVGGGPVGLSLAIDLAARGIDVRRRAATGGPAHQRQMQWCKLTMEIFRRLGLADSAQGRLDAITNDVVFARFGLWADASRSLQEWKLYREGLLKWWPTPEPPSHQSDLLGPVRCSGCANCVDLEPHRVYRRWAGGRFKRAILKPERPLTRVPISDWLRWRTLDNQAQIGAKLRR